MFDVVDVVKCCCVVHVVVVNVVDVDVKCWCCEFLMLLNVVDVVKCCWLLLNVVDVDVNVKCCCWCCC